MPKRNRRRSRKRRRGGGAIENATQNLTAATRARVAHTQKQVTEAAAKAVADVKTQAHKVQHQVTTGVADQINKAAAAVRPPQPTLPARIRQVVARVGDHVHRGINRGATHVRQALNGVPATRNIPVTNGVAPVTRATHVAHRAANQHLQRLQAAALQQHRRQQQHLSRRPVGPPLPRRAMPPAHVGGRKTRRRRRRRRRTRRRTRRRRRRR